MKKLLLIGIMLVGLLTGCETMQNTTTKNGQLNLKVFQTFYNTEKESVCLARNLNWEVFYIISLECPGKTKAEMFYDDKNISGYYNVVGTYTYETKEGNQKTVQACMKKSNFDDLYNYDKGYLKSVLNLKLSYSLVE